MMLHAYTLYDCKALTYSPPFFTTAHGAAVRMVMDLAADPNTSVGRHPADYTLYCVGRWNDGTGELQPLPTREHVSDVLALVPRAELGGLFPNGVQSGNAQVGDSPEVAAVRRDMANGGK